MEIGNKIREWMGVRSGRLMRTPFGLLRLSKGDEQAKKKLVAELLRRTDSLTRSDLGDWRKAWQAAINVENPQRGPLLDIYRDVSVDLHLSGCVEQRKGMVMSRSFHLVDEEGSENEEALRLLEQSWFKHLMSLTLDSIYWGHSLIELGEVTRGTDGLLKYADVTLIPRKHVVPEKHRVVRQAGDDWHNGVDWEESPWCDWVIEAGERDDLGLYLKAATQTIPKKNTLAFWDTFAEIFGMPMRIARTTSRDKKELKKMEQMMEDMGTAGWGLFQQGTEIEVVETSRGDAFNVYDKRIDRANSELSKLIIGQTMTLEDGSSLSQSQTHMAVLQQLVEADADRLKDLVNGQLLPRMCKHGFPVAGLHFEWDYSTDYTPEQQVVYEQLLLQHYEIDPEYFSNKYNMPVGAALPVSGRLCPVNPPQDGGGDGRKNARKNAGRMHGGDGDGGARKNAGGMHGDGDGDARKNAGRMHGDEGARFFD